MMAIERFRADAFVASCIEEISVNLLPPEKGADFYKCDGWHWHDRKHLAADGVYDSTNEQIHGVYEGSEAKTHLEKLLGTDGYHIDQIYGTSDINSLHKQFNNSSFFTPYVAAHVPGTAYFIIISEGTVSGSKIEDYYSTISTKNAS